MKHHNCFLLLLFKHSPLKLVVWWRVLCCDVGQLSKDLATVDSEAGEQDELLPGGAEQAGVVLYGELTEEGQLLDPGDLAEEQLVCQTAQQSKQLHLCYLVPRWANNNETWLGWTDVWWAGKLWSCQNGPEVAQNSIPLHSTAVVHLFLFSAAFTSLTVWFPVPLYSPHFTEQICLAFS